jgi:hypothetical protein
MVEGQNQHRYFIRAGLSTKPMKAHEVEAAFQALASTPDRIEATAGGMPLVPRIVATRTRDTDSSEEPGDNPWVSVVLAPLDPGAELPMRNPSSYDFPANDLHARYLRGVDYLSRGRYELDSWGYVDLEEDEGFYHRVLRLFRNGWCEWGLRYSRLDDELGLRIPGLVLVENVHDALVYFAQTYADRPYYGRLRVWVRIDNADESVLLSDRPGAEAGSPDVAISFESDTSTEQLLSEPLRVVHAAADRLWQGYGLPRCPIFSPEGELLRSSRG